MKVKRSTDGKSWETVFAAPSVSCIGKRRYLGYRFCGLWQSEQGWKVRPLHLLVVKCIR